MQGAGTSANPWQITTAQELAALATYVNTDNGSETNGKYYKLMNDIDLSEYTSDAGWTPIGINSPDNANYRFQGNFDGNGKVVRNLAINRPGQDYVGLFGYTSEGSISNLGVEGSGIIGRSNAGGLAGRCNGTTINNSYAAVNVTGAYYCMVGGLVGRFSGAIDNCYATGDVAGNSSTSISVCNVGGLVGQANLDTYSYINNSYATGNVTGSGAYSLTNCNVGGLIGENNRPVNNCYATGNVTGNALSGASCNAGGLVGYNYAGNISNSYATGDITGNAATNSCYIGGLVGRGSGIRSCIAANNSISSTVYTDYINRISGSIHTNNNNYALNTMTVLNNNIDISASITDGLNTEAGRGKDMSVLQSRAFYNTPDNWYNNTAWIINPPAGIWDICEGEGLPFLRWQGIKCNHYTISGKVTFNGNPLEDVEINYVAGFTNTNELGEYSITVDYGASLTLTASKTGYQFSPASIVYNDISTNIENQNFSAATTGIVDIIKNISPKIIAYFNILGQKLSNEPDKGLYIILCDDGTMRKIMK
jgi:hypothetical protein